MDGYAVIAEDTFGAGPLRSDARCTASSGSTPVRCPRAALARGECIEIATGAPMPAGADAVVMVEETEKESDDRSSRPDAGLSAPARRTTRRGHRCRAGGARGGRSSEPQPDRRARGHRHHRGRRLRSPAHRDPLDRQRDRRAWISRSALDRSTTSIASRSRRSSRRTAASPVRLPDRARHARRI